MKLQNKKTGEVADLTLSNNGETLLLVQDGEIIAYDVDLEHLANNWEDYEEPKGMWTIGQFGELYEVSGLALNRIKELEDIGNIYKTEEDAERAVEKLKAWKRLKDIGCDFDGWDIKTSGSEGEHLIIHLHIRDFTKCGKYLDLLFGGEE